MSTSYPPNNIFSGDGITISAGTQGNSYTFTARPSSGISNPSELAEWLHRQMQQQQMGPLGMPPPTLTPIQQKERELDEREAALTRREQEVAARLRQLVYREQIARDEEAKAVLRAREARQSVASGPWALFHLQRGAPLEVVEAVYRALSRKYHPDANPNDATALAKMQAINAAIDQIRREAERGER